MNIGLMAMMQEVIDRQNAELEQAMDEIKSLRIEIDELKQELYAKIAMLQELLQDTEMLNSDAAYSRLIMRDYNE